MIEGGEKLYQEVREIVDWKLFIVNVDRVIDRDNFQFDENLEHIYLMQRKDLFIFSK
jgi:diaminohydroxyphosphoribosylaminopyrimidine deaminase/5-amino-6-(5-phosphoribosylamino)uracil reductase